jgi:hypothetical protein
MRRIVLGALIPAGLLIAAHAAQAQGFNPSGLPGGGSAPPTAPRAAPADALPGARTDRERVTPAGRNATEMDPNDALFDSINRGDITTARDAIKRGADLHARNVLGMSPLDLSVDLGRNDITFLLLSLRGTIEDNRGRPPLVATAETPQGRHGRGARGATLASVDLGGPPPPTDSAVRQPPVPHGRAPATAPVASKNSPHVAQQFAGNGGTPVPQAGFLGFDSGVSR